MSTVMSSAGKSSIFTGSLSVPASTMREKTRTSPRISTAHPTTTPSSHVTSTLARRSGWWERPRSPKTVRTSASATRASPTGLVSWIGSPPDSVVTALPAIADPAAATRTSQARRRRPLPRRAASSPLTTIDSPPITNPSELIASLVAWGRSLSSSTAKIADTPRAPPSATAKARVGVARTDHLTTSQTRATEPPARVNGVMCAADPDRGQTGVWAASRWVRRHHEGSHLARSARHPRGRRPRPPHRRPDGRDHQDHLHRALRVRPAPDGAAGAVHVPRRRPGPRADGHRRGDRQCRRRPRGRRPRRDPLQRQLRLLLDVRARSQQPVRDHPEPRPGHRRQPVRLQQPVRLRPRRTGRAAPRAVRLARRDEGAVRPARRPLPLPLRRAPHRLAGGALRRGARRRHAAGGRGGPDRRHGGADRAARGQAGDRGRPGPRAARPGRGPRRRDHRPRRRRRHRGRGAGPHRRAAAPTRWSRRWGWRPTATRSRRRRSRR